MRNVVVWIVLASSLGLAFAHDDHPTGDPKTIKEINVLVREYEAAKSEERLGEIAARLKKIAPGHNEILLEAVRDRQRIAPERRRTLRLIAYRGLAAGELRRLAAESPELGKTLATTTPLRLAGLVARLRQAERGSTTHELVALCRLLMAEARGMQDVERLRAECIRTYYVVANFRWGHHAVTELRRLCDSSNSSLRLRACRSLAMLPAVHGLDTFAHRMAKEYAPRDLLKGDPKKLPAAYQASVEIFDMSRRIVGDALGRKVDLKLSDTLKRREAVVAQLKPTLADRVRALSGELERSILQRVTIDAEIEVVLSSEASNRRLQLRIGPPSSKKRVRIQLIVMENGEDVVSFGPIETTDGGSAAVSVPWGGRVRVAVKRFDASSFHVLIEETPGAES